MTRVWACTLAGLVAALVTMKRRQDFRDEAIRRHLRWLEINRRD